MKIQEYHKALAWFIIKGFGMTGLALPIVYATALRMEITGGAVNNFATLISPWVWVASFFVVGFFATCGFIIYDLRGD